MENSDEQTRKKIKVLKTLLGLIPTPENNFNPAKREVELMILMDIQLLDHLIILPVEGYYSFADEGVV